MIRRVCLYGTSECPHDVPDAGDAQEQGGRDRGPPHHRCNERHRGARCNPHVGEK